MDSPRVPTTNLARRMAIVQCKSIKLRFTRGVDAFLNLAAENSKDRARWLRAAQKLQKYVRSMSSGNILVNSGKVLALMSDVCKQLESFLTSSCFGRKENEDNLTPMTTTLFDLASEVLQEHTVMDTESSSLPALHLSSGSSSLHHPVALPGSPNSDSGPKVLFHVIRHGQAAHNIIKDSPTACGMFDPPLTPKGEAQCQLVQSSFPNMRNISLILCSPSYRTRQTALIGFKALFDAGMKMHLWNQLKEWGTAPCNSGWNKDVMMFMNDPKCDLGMLDMDWNTAQEVGNYGRNRAEATRSKEVRRELHDLSKALLDGGRWHHLDFPKHNGENNIEVLIVSHGDFLSHLLRMGGPKFKNAQYRTAQFPTETDLATEGISWKPDDLVVAGWESVYNTSLNTIQ